MHPDLAGFPQDGPLVSGEILITSPVTSPTRMVTFDRLDPDAEDQFFDDKGDRYALADFLIRLGPKATLEARADAEGKRQMGLRAERRAASEARKRGETP